MSKKNKILLLFFHPLSHKSRINKVMREAAEKLENVTVRDMYNLYPDFHIDISKEQELMLDHDILVLQHPFYWYSSPSLLKEWMDLVLEHGFAYGSKGRALEGKALMSAISTGGRQESYSGGTEEGYSIRQLLAPFEQSFTLCRMNYLSPFVTHGTHLLKAEDYTLVSDHYTRVLSSLGNKIPGKKAMMKDSYMNEIIP